MVNIRYSLAFGFGFDSLTLTLTPTLHQVVRIIKAQKHRLHYFITINKHFINLIMPSIEGFKVRDSIDSSLSLMIIKHLFKLLNRIEFVGQFHYN